MVKHKYKTDIFNNKLAVGDKMKLLQGCTFCINDSEAETDIKKRTIIETPNFRVFPTLGQITEGYVLIVPKEHHAAVGAFPNELFPELKDLKDDVKKKN